MHLTGNNKFLREFSKFEHCIHVYGELIIVTDTVSSPRIQELTIIIYNKFCIFKNLL